MNCSDSTTPPDPSTIASNTMKKVSVYFDTLETVIQRLEEAIEVNYLAPDNPEQGYPYATGYSRAAMQGVVEALRPYLEQ